jgi:ABC-2 type transport system permease protein
MSALTGAGTLLRANLRYDGRRFAPWIAIATLLPASSVVAYPWVFPDAAERAGLSAVIGGNPALGLVFGPAFDLSTNDGFTSWRSLALGGFLVALGAILTVTRAARGQEDSGQAELLASGVLGRGSRLAAAIGVASLGSLAAGVISGVATALCGGDWQASLLLGATFTASGWLFGALAAVTSQLGTDARSAVTLAVAILGVLFLARGLAYSLSADDWAIWSNPLGWLTETRPASGNDWLPLVPAVGLAIVLLALAVVLQLRRDFGQGLVPTRPGPARGRLHSVTALVWRLNRGTIIAWLCAFALLGVVFGYFARSVHTILEDNPAVAQILAAGAVDKSALTSEFLATILSLVGIIAAVGGVQIVHRVRSEELDDRLEVVLAGAVSRTRTYLASIAVAAVTTAVFVLVTGLGVAWLAATGDVGVEFGDALLQAVATIPAVWTVVAVAVAVTGAHPAVSLAAWAGVLVSFVLTLLGPTFKLWDWVLAISPFWHVPSVTDANADWWGLLWISLVTLALTLVGVVGFRRRDIGR